MKTLEILTADETIIAPKLKALKLKELERHAQKLLQRKANANYETVIGEVIKAVPKLGGDSAQKYKTVQNIVNAHFSSEAEVAEDQALVVERLSVILMVIIAKKFDRIHNG